MSTSGWKFFLNARPWDSYSELHLRYREGVRGQTLRVVGLTTEVLEEGAPLAEPVLRQSRYDTEDSLGDVTGFLQAALDCAWEHGLRPRGFDDHTNELRATRTHLEDMRALVFKSDKP